MNKEYLRQKRKKTRIIPGYTIKEHNNEKAETDLSQKLSHEQSMAGRNVARKMY